MPRIPITSIRVYEAVPSFTGRALVRLPRCANCFYEVHDYCDGVATCIPISGRYCRMGAEMMHDWEAAEDADAAAKPFVESLDNPVDDA